VTTASSGRASVPGSERTPLPDSTRVGPVDPGDDVNVTVLLRRRGGAELPSSPGAPQLSRAEFEAAYGADPADASRVESFGREYGLRTSAIDMAARTVSLAGPAAAMSAAFGVELSYYDHPGGRYRGREGPVTVPAELAGVVVGVFGLDTRSQARPHVVVTHPDPAVAGAALEGTFTPLQVAALYGFPRDVTGNGQCVAIVEFGGGYLPADLSAFFATLGIPSPTVVAVSVDGASNSFANGTDPADGEVTLDVEVAGAVAPGARLAVYFAPNTDQGFVDAISKAVHDATNDPSVLSISWGGPENSWTDQARSAIDQAFADAATLGVSVFVAAGDHGSADRPPFVADASGAQTKDPDYDGLAHVDFPSSSPHAIACGGTHLEADGTVVSRETAWNDENGWATGGGVSDFFDLPSWQAGAGVPHSVNAPGTRVGRGVPDVCANADSRTGYQILLDGQTAIVGGTSAVAPLWAGLTALLNEVAGRRLGFLAPLLYSRGSAGALRDIKTGNNAIPALDGQVATSGYVAGTGWDGCTGLGSPDGAGLSALLADGAAGG
jgi:kumamolisin